MEFNNLNVLKKDVKQDNLYDLIEITFKNIGPTVIKSYTVEEGDEMRIDNVCSKIYGTTDNVDFLIDLNDIDNGLNVMVGDIINFVDTSILDLYKISTNDAQSTRSSLLNINKATKKDDNRKKYVEENYSLPPTFLETPSESVTLENGKITLGGKR
jgi:hypothetical protein